MTGDELVEKALASAQRFAADGHTERAYDVICDLYEAFPNVESPLLAQLRARWRYSLLDTYRRRFSDMNLFPQRAPMPVDLKKYRLRSHEVFLYEQIDGSVSIEDTLAISPVDEIDTFRAISKLASFQLISLTPEFVAA